MATYEVQWSKQYYASGHVEIEAENKEEAKKIAEERLGDYEGSMQYDPDGDHIFVLGTKEQVDEYILAMKEKEYAKL